MKLSDVAPPSATVVNCGRLVIASSDRYAPSTYNGEVCFVDGWVYVEVKETDGEGSVNVYPANQVLVAQNVYPVGWNSETQSVDSTPVV